MSTAFPSPSSRPASLTAKRLLSEWPTLALAGGVYLAFGLLSWHWQSLSLWLAVPLAACVLTLFGSLSHEVIHAHPTGRRALDEALVWPCLWLWCPYPLYRDSHLAHHRDEHLTDPVADPESYYLQPEVWARLPATTRWLLMANNTFAGRMLIGPPLALSRLLAVEGGRVLRGERRALAVWSGHLLACAPVLAWAWGVCGIAPLEYLLAWVWPSIALTQVRSFAEHRASPVVAHRTAVVEAGLPFSLLFLNLNLHVVHHAMPGLPWYRLPRVWQTRREAFTRLSGGHVYRGYGEVAWRFLLRPRDQVAHPKQETVNPTDVAAESARVRI